MAISFSSAFAGHDKTLEFRGSRAAVLANNIANADTPNFKARDMTFDSMLNSEQDRLKMVGANERHISGGGFASGLSDGLLYRNANQPSLDGNNVDMQREQAEYAQNSLQFDTSFLFLNGKISGMKKALIGN